MADNNTLLVPRFFMHTSLNETESKAKGRPIFDEFEAVEIRFPGDRQKVAVFPAHETEPNATRESIAAGGEPQTYAMVFNKQYREFKDGNAQSIAGTPLSELPFLTEGKRRELKALNVHTAEQLAALDGNPLKQLGMGGREMKNQAQAYLDNAAGSADVTALAAEVESLRRQLQERDDLIKDVTSARTNNKYQKEARRQERELAQEAADEAEDDDTTQEEAAEEQEQPANENRSAFEDFEADDIKAWIKDATGVAPKGNPSKATLVKMADEINERLAEKNGKV